VALATKELAQLGLVQPDQIERGFVVRMPKAYPFYDKAYHANIDTIRTWIADEVPNVHPVGRNGMHRYNNQDHSMLTAILSVQNIVEGHAARRVAGQRRGRLPRGADGPLQREPVEPYVDEPGRREAARTAA
jgi:protoporphyrinogen oxidase